MERITEQWGDVTLRVLDEKYYAVFVGDKRVSCWYRRMGMAVNKFVDVWTANGMKG